MTEEGVGGISTAISWITGIIASFWLFTGDKFPCYSLILYHNQAMKILFQAMRISLLAMSICNQAMKILFLADLQVTLADLQTVQTDFQANLTVNLMVPSTSLPQHQGSKYLGPSTYVIEYLNFYTNYDITEYGSQQIRT